MNVKWTWINYKNTNIIDVLSCNKRISGISGSEFIEEFKELWERTYLLRAEEFDKKEFESLMFEIVWLMRELSDRMKLKMGYRHLLLFQFICWQLVMKRFYLNVSSLEYEKINAYLVGLCSYGNISWKYWILNDLEKQLLVMLKATPKNFSPGEMTGLNVDFTTRFDNVHDICIEFLGAQLSKSGPGVDRIFWNGSYRVVVRTRGVPIYKQQTAVPARVLKFVRGFLPAGGKLGKCSNEYLLWPKLIEDRVVHKFKSYVYVPSKIRKTIVTLLKKSSMIMYRNYYSDDYLPLNWLEIFTYENYDEFRAFKKRNKNVTTKDMYYFSKNTKNITRCDKKLFKLVQDFRWGFECTWPMMMKNIKLFWWSVCLPERFEYYNILDEKDDQLLADIE